MSTEEGIALARSLAADDGTRGMIIYRLKQHGFDSQEAAGIVDQALASDKKQHRFGGLGQLILGVTLLTIGLGMSLGTMILANSTRGVSTIAIGLIISGLALSVKGTVRAILGADRLE